MFVLKLTAVTVLLLLLIHLDIFSIMKKISHRKTQENDKTKLVVLVRYSHSEKNFYISNYLKMCINPCLFLSNQKCLNKNLSDRSVITRVDMFPLILCRNLYS